MQQPIALVILDGFGHKEGNNFNAIAQAHTPQLDTLMAQYPHTTLAASGTAVGLLKGFIGNSEVGHTTIGAGRIVEQPVSIIHKTIVSGELSQNKKLTRNLRTLAQNGKQLHLIGLLSDAGVHSHQELLYALIGQAVTNGIKQIIIHPILDGRDVAPQSAQTYLEQLQQYIADKPQVRIGSLHGRQYAMDRDQNWERTQKSTYCLTAPQRARFDHWQQAIAHWYAQDVFDEHIHPMPLGKNICIQPKDGIVFFNFRPDRARQLAKLLLEQQKTIPLSFFITPFVIDPELSTTTLFEKEPTKQTLLDILATHNKTIYAIAETEKYAHITYFFTSGRQTAKENETHVLIPSIKTNNYALSPEMSAKQITQSVLYSLETDPKDFYLINYANADMIGHTGDMQATIKAIECLDAQIALLEKEIVQKLNGTLIITADHGNAEEMFDITTNQPKTAHTANPVPFIVINQVLKRSKERLSLKNLADIAPYILHLFGIKTPNHMHKKPSSS